MFFSSNHVWIWELDHKERWAPNNWFVWTVVLEKALESPLEFKEIKPVHPKGNQSWIFIGSLMLKLQYFGHMKWRADFFERTLMVAKAGGKGDDRGWDSWMATLIQWTWAWASSGVNDVQGSLAYCSPWVCKQPGVTEWLNCTKLNWSFIILWLIIAMTAFFVYLCLVGG